MSCKPIMRQMAWISLFPQLLVYAVLITIYYLLFREWRFSILLTCLTYLIISRGSKLIFLRHHKNGMMAVKSNDYPTAIRHFENSFAFLCRHPAPDKYRYLLLLDSSKISYTEMALINIAYCNIKLGHINEAKQYYSRAVELFPNSVAKDFLNSIENVEKTEE